jgi:5-(aminomethyl)-3-furanmethanol phosphate kinase
MSLRVLKLGGSLLDLPELAARFGRWLDRQESGANVMIAGGGALADAIRAADRTHALGEAAAHELCLQVMGVTAALAERIFTGSRLCTDLGQIDRRLGSPLQILDVRNVLAQRGDSSLREASSQQASATAPALPQSWQVTSDSIAAHVACRLQADELVLLKSALPSTGVTPQAVAASGFVDGHFPRALGRFEVRIVNFRDSDFAECRLAHRPTGVLADARH